MFLKELLHRQLAKNMLVRNAAATFGVILWVGALSPEIFVVPGEGCIVGEDGQELSKEDAQAFMEAYFYADTDKADGEEVNVKYKLAFLEWLEK